MIIILGECSSYVLESDDISGQPCSTLLKTATCIQKGPSVVEDNCHLSYVGSANGGAISYSTGAGTLT